MGSIQRIRAVHTSLLRQLSLFVVPALRCSFLRPYRAHRIPTLRPQQLARSTKMPSIALIYEIRDEFLADDVPVDEEVMTEWTESELRRHFESGGTERPPQPMTTASSTAQHHAANVVCGVELAIPASVDAMQLRLPAPLRGNPLSVRDSEAERTLRWMCQKAALGQDMFLIADAPGGRARGLAFEFCRRAR
eukprot:723434-Prymnesium_polylepis.1